MDQWASEERGLFEGAIWAEAEGSEGVIHADVWRQMFSRGNGQVQSARGKCMLGIRRAPREDSRDQNTTNEWGGAGGGEARSGERRGWRTIIQEAVAKAGIECKRMLLESLEQWSGVILGGQAVPNNRTLHDDGNGLKSAVSNKPLSTRGYWALEVGLMHLSNWTFHSIEFWFESNMWLAASILGSTIWNFHWLLCGEWYIGRQRDRSRELTLEALVIIRTRG